MAKKSNILAQEISEKGMSLMESMTTQLNDSIELAHSIISENSKEIKRLTEENEKMQILVNRNEHIVETILNLS